MHIEDFRREYLAGGLQREDLLDNPYTQFERWLEQAVQGGLADPTAMSIATVDDRGRPWQRIVLLKDFSPEGFVFYTNLGSRKATEIAGNAQVCLLFPWNTLERQVIVSGVAERLPSAQVARYFLSRPRESQLAAWASKQSRPISGRQVLEQKFAEIKHRFQQGEVPLPSFWGGYRVVPESIEFWQGGANRLHDRFMYRLNESGDWDIDRLCP